MNDGRRIARNAVSAYAVRGLVGLSALLLTPYLFRRLGAEGFGTWSVMFTLWTIFELIETGFSAGVIKLVSESRGSGRRGELRETVGAAVVLMGLLGGLALLLSAAAAWLLTGLAAPSEAESFQKGMLLLGAAMAIRYPCVAYAAALRGYQRHDLANAAEGLVIIGLAGGAVAAVEAGHGALGVAAALAISLAVGGLASLLLMAVVDRGVLARPRLGSAPRRIVGFSSFALLADSMIFVGQRMDVIIIAAIRNAASAAPFAAALKLQSGVQALTLPFVTLLMPMVSDLWARREREEVVRRLTLATRGALQITLPVGVAIALFAEDIVGLWLGKSAPPVTTQIIVVLVAVQAATLAGAPAEKVLLGVGRVRAIGMLALAEGLANVSLTVFLVSRYGAVGAALGTLLTSAVLAPVKFPLVCRAIGCSTAEFLRRSVAAAVLSSLPALAAMGATWLLMPPGTLRLVTGVGVGVGLALAIGVSQIGFRRTLAALRGRAPVGIPSASPRVMAEVPVEPGPATPR